MDVLDEDGPGASAVAPPELGAGGPIVCPEEQAAADGGEGVGIRAFGSRMDVLDQDGPRMGPVAPPEFEPAGSIVCREEQNPADGREVERERAPGSRVDVLREDGLALVPSLLQSSPPWVPSSARKNSLSPTFLSPDG